MKHCKTKGWMTLNQNFSVSWVINRATLSLYKDTFLDLTKVIQTLDAVFITGTLWLIFLFTLTVNILYLNNPWGRKTCCVFYLEAVISIHYRDFYDNHDTSLQHSVSVIFLVKSLPFTGCENCKSVNVNYSFITWLICKIKSTSSVSEICGEIESDCIAGREDHITLTGSHVAHNLGCLPWITIVHLKEISLMKVYIYHLGKETILI